MKENVKNTTKALYTMCICLIVVMGVLFLGNSLTKGTYSAGTVLTKNTKYCSKSRYVLNGNKCCPSGYGLYNGGVSCCPSGYSWSSGDSICVNSSGKQISPTAAVPASTCKAGNILNGNTCTANSSSSCTYTSAGHCQTATGKSCVIDAKGCYVPVSSGSNPVKCDYATIAACETNNPGWICAFDNGCPVKKSKRGNGIMCPGGTYYADPTCYRCLPGTYCPANTPDDSRVLQCDKGYYCPEGSSEQIRCPVDRPYSEARSNSLSDCKAETDDGARITLRFYNGSTLVKSESCFKANGSDSCKDTIYAPGPQAKTGKIFNGWGEKDGCTTGSYTANASFRANTSRNYYACYTDTIDDTPSSTFDKSKCTYSNDTAVVRDDRYKNCKYTNITYNNSASELTEGNAKACCMARGYTWVRENFTSSGYGYEYCIKCSSGGDVTPDPIPDPDPEPPTSTPTNPPTSTPTSTPSSNVDENPKTGSIAIFMVWVIAIGTLIYSIAYFKQSKFE